MEYLLLVMSYLALKRDNSMFTLISFSFSLSTVIILAFMEKITGIGGCFFRSKDPEALATWYEKNFGINSMSSTSVWEQAAGPTVFAPFNADSSYFPATQSCMFNFRVSDMAAMLAQLEANGVKIDEKKQEDSIGTFAWVYDPEGNKIELWEPTQE